MFWEQTKKKWCQTYVNVSLMCKLNCFSCKQSVENLNKMEADYGDSPTLVCTDLAAGGLDLDVDHICCHFFSFHCLSFFSPPNVPFFSLGWKFSHVLWHFRSTTCILLEELLLWVQKVKMRLLSINDFFCSLLSESEISILLTNFFVCALQNCSKHSAPQSPCCLIYVLCLWFYRILTKNNASHGNMLKSSFLGLHLFFFIFFFSFHLQF